MLPLQEAPCALQPKPELHKAFLIILNFHIKIDFDHFDHDHLDQMAAAKSSFFTLHSSLLPVPTIVGQED